jgi:N-acetylated-alpha-linked acidic dipeptidase
MYAQKVKLRDIPLKYLYQVAVAKNLGLQTLRLASALVLPFNTTHYAFELANYLDG